MLKIFDKKLLLKFIAPYLLLVLVVSVIQYISNVFVLDALEENVVEIINNSFKNDITVIEQNLGKVKETAAVIAQNTAGKFEKVSKDDKNFYSELARAREELSSYCTMSSGIVDICLQYDDTDVLISFGNAYSNRLAYYQTMLSCPDKTAEELLASSEQAGGFSVDNICYYESTRRAIPFVYPTPILKKRTGSVTVYIDEQTLLTPVNDLLEKSNGTLKIIGDSGQVVSVAGNKSFISGNNTEMQKSNYYTFKETGISSKWEYIISLPEGYVLSKVNYYQTVSLIFDFLVLIIAFGICLSFTIRKIRSYSALLDILEIKSEAHTDKSYVLKDEYAGLKNHIFKIKTENKLLLENGIQSLLRRILNGQLDKNEEIINELKNHKLEIKGLFYGVIFINYSAENIPDSIRTNFNNIMWEKVRKIVPEAQLCFMDSNSVAILFPYDGDSFEIYAKKCVAALERELFSKYHIDILVGIGEKVTELCDISTSYKHACEVAEYKFLTKEKDIYFYEFLPSEDDYYYPIAVENALIKSILESNFEAARDLLRKIQKENFIKRSLGVSAINELLTEIRATIKKMCRLQAEYLEFSHELCSVNHFFENAISFIHMICDASEKKETQSRGQKICSEIKNYIELHHSNPNLSLNAIAEEFRLHPNYLSNLFKKQTGLNLISFLETTRIEKAAELLVSGKYTVNEVAVSVGFTNDSTFRRCFKKIKGVSPSAFFK